MEKYNFDRQINRRDTNSIKWDLYGKDVLPLWVADMDFAVSPKIVAALENRIAHPVFGYAGPDEQLLEAIREWVYRQHGWQITTEQIMLMPGVVTGINWMAHTFKEAQSGLLIQTPVYPPFFKAAANSGMQLIESPLIRGDSQYEVDFDDFEQKVSQGAKVFVLCNPHNPVGRVYSREELEKIGEICLRHNVLICSDEIHCDLVYSGNRHIPIASLSEELAQNTVTLMAASKTFNIPGLHFSFAVVSNPKLRERMEAAGAGIIGHPSVLANEAAKAAFTACDDWLEELLAYLESNRDYVLEYLAQHLPEINVFAPQGTYLAWLDCRKLDLQPDPYTFFLENAGVALNDGRTFGINGEGFVRLNFGCQRATLEKALDLMSAAVKQR